MEARTTYREDFSASKTALAGVAEHEEIQIDDAPTKKKRPSAALTSGSSNYESELIAAKEKFYQGRMLAFGPDSELIFERMEEILEQQRQLASEHLSLEAAAATTFHEDPKNIENADDTELPELYQDNAEQFADMLAKLSDLNAAIESLHIDDFQR